MSDSLVSIGMPIYNSENTISAAIESIINQTYRNLEIIISDNCSSDGTFKICQGYAELDSRIKIHKQVSNIGATRNFDYVLRNSNGKYFMWAAGDDYRSLDFIEVNKIELDNNDEYVASTSPDLLGEQENNNFKFELGGIYGNQAERFFAFVKIRRRSHGLFYSLMRSEVIKNCTYVNEAFFAWDWAIVLFLAASGSINRSKFGFIHFSDLGESSSSSIYNSLSLKGYKTLFPFRQFMNKKKDFGYANTLDIYFSVITVFETI